MRERMDGGSRKKGVRSYGEGEERVGRRENRRKIEILRGKLEGGNLERREKEGGRERRRKEYFRDCSSSLNPVPAVHLVEASYT